jgi:predicted kinase
MLTKVIVVSGISGGGKSTLVKSLTSEASVIFSADHFFEHPYGSGKDYRFDPTKLGAAHGQCLLKFTELLSELYNTPQMVVDVIVVDNTNLTALEMAPYVSLAMAYGCPVEIITVKCDPEVAAKRNKHGVPLAAIKGMAARLQQRQLPAFWKDIPRREVDTNPID